MYHLNQRHQVGLDDFVLLEDFTNQDAFIQNLRSRYEANIIYVSNLNINSLFIAV
jgi:hypothetical protein